MAYNIAVASTDGVNIDKHFGATNSFFIIKVNDDGTYENLGERFVGEESNCSCGSSNNNSSSCSSASCDSSSSSCASPNSGSSCGGTSGGHSCGGHNDPEIQKKVDTISDCRSLLCAKCGPGSEKQLGKNNISTFEINLKIEEALKIIIKYFKKSDGHQSLKDIRK